MRKVTATGKAITTPELLRLICEYCSNRENHHNALVSKTWSNEALTILWHSLDSLAPLLSLLAPLKIGEDSCYEFERHIRPSDWVAFRKYSWRVHTICTGYQTDFDLATSAFIDLASSRPGTDLLPNLRRLYYTDSKLSFRFIPLFIPTYLIFINLNLMFEHTDAHRAICKEILSYLPEKAVHLQHLRLSTLGEVTAHDVDAFQLAQVISALPTLKTVEIGASFLSPECLQSLAHLQYLEALTLSPHDYTEPTLTITPSPNTFPSLTHFSTDGHTHEDIIRFLDTCKPRALRSLFVDGRDDGASFPDLCRAAGSVCPGLRCLSLVNATMHHSNPDLIVPENYFSMVYDHLNLTSLSLDDLPPSSPNMKTIIDLLRGLPSLRKLSLNTRRHGGTGVMCRDVVDPQRACGLSHRAGGLQELEDS
ncbi:hypothetical protein EYR36_004048 [Pleurotus pulmonarius]|nr:hypothetical protein EYR36_004048 [Pleurotus pulmonarius]